MLGIGVLARKVFREPGGEGGCVSLMKLGCRDRGKKQESERARKEREARPNPGYCQLPTQTAQLL